jgi:phosphoribosylformylglycinamidine cyclo-ligase
MAHITGGGLTENIVRVLPEGLGLALDTGAWPCPAVFHWLQETGGISDTEMRRTFNMGIGFALIVAEDEAPAVAETLGEPAPVIGRVLRHEHGERVRYL